MSVNQNTETDQLLELYDPGELAILFDWLQVPRPAQLKELKHEWQIWLDEEEEGVRAPIRLQPSEGGRQDLPAALSNAVARLVLSGIQDHLPQWAVAYQGGGIEFSRQHEPRRRVVVDLMPRFQFRINWADTAPGFSWPEDYYATYLPGFDIYVVTASQDSADKHGYTDEAIGYFGTDTPVADGVREAIMDWWSMQANEWNQRQWAYVWMTGEIGSETAEAWAATVWDAETGEPLSWSS